VHPSKRYFAVAEKGIYPSIFIYEFTEPLQFSLVKTLRKGTERAYSDVTWSNDGTKFASVGSAPDYMLILWDWEKERILLRTKAFSQASCGKHQHEMTTKRFPHCYLFCCLESFVFPFV
jgi:WD40 repeat protein